MRTKTKSVLGQTLFLVSATLLAVLPQISCGSNSDSSTPSANGAPPVAPPAGGVQGVSQNWSKLAEMTTCEAMQPDHCIGSSGFTVTNAGQFTVGPAPDGQTTLTGQLTRDELTMISADADAVVALGTQNPPNCVAGGSVPGVSDTINMTLPDTTMAQVYSLTLTSTCYINDTATDTKLQNDLHTLLVKYYPVPFPGSTASASVQSGHWGGTGATLDVTSTSSTLQLDCAHGAITGPIPLDSQGNFNVAGTYTQEGGAEPAGGRPSVPATFSGTVNSNVLQLTVTPTGGTSTDYTLNFGDTGSLTRCL